MPNQELVHSDKTGHQKHWHILMKQVPTILAHSDDTTHNKELVHSDETGLKK